MCSFPKDPTGGLFDFNKDGKLDVAEYTLMNDVLYHDSDEDTDDTEDSDEYCGAAEPPVRCGESHLSGLTEPPQLALHCYLACAGSNP